MEKIDWFEIMTEAGRAAWVAAGARPLTIHACAAATQAANEEVLRCLSTIGQQDAHRPHVRFVLASPIKVEVVMPVVDSAVVATIGGLDQWSLANVAHDAWARMSLRSLG